MHAFLGILSYYVSMPVSDEQQETERFNAAAHIEETTTEDIHRKQSSLQSKTIALLGTIVALSIAMFTVPAATLDDTPLVALIPGCLLLLAGVLPGVPLIFGKTKETEWRLPNGAPYRLDLRQLAESRSFSSHLARRRADARLERDSSRYWRWAIISSVIAIISFVMLILVMTFTERSGDEQGRPETINGAEVTTQTAGDSKGSASS